MCEETEVSRGQVIFLIKNRLLLARLVLKTYFSLNSEVSALNMYTKCLLEFCVFLTILIVEFHFLQKIK